MKIPYEAPTIFTLGSVVELTESGDPPDKCGGSADFALPQLLREEFGTPHCD